MRAFVEFGIGRSDRELEGAAAEMNVSTGGTERNAVQREGVRWNSKMLQRFFESEESS